MTERIDPRPPESDGGGLPFWDGLKEGRLVVSRCRACGRRSFPPIATCPHCGAAEVEAADAAGGGAIYSWATVHMPLAAEFASQAPYTIVVVDLDEGARVFGRLLGSAAGLAAGAPVRFEPYRDGGRSLPGFRLAEAAR
jgi:uncharacterized OB-fold protein